MDVEQLRADTPGTAHRAHLNNAGAALMSRRTLRAMTDQLELEAGIGGYEAAAESADLIEGTYEGMARLLGADRAEIALFDNSTHAWAAGFYAVPLGPGDRILTGRAEYGSNVLSYLQVAARTGAELVVVPNDDAGQIDLAALAELADERTKLIGLTYVPTFGGLVNPAAEVGRIARAAGALYLLDDPGRRPVPGGRRAARLRPAVRHRAEVPARPARHRLPLRPVGGDGTAGAGRGRDRLGHLGRRARLPLAGRGEAVRDLGTSGVNIVGFGAAVEQALELGLAEIGARATALGARLRDQLDALPKVTTHDQGRTRCAIVTASVAGVAAEDVAAALAAAGVNVTMTDTLDNPLDSRNAGCTRWSGSRRTTTTPRRSPTAPPG